MKKSLTSDGYDPHYPFAAIYNVATLSKALGVSELRLARVAATANKLYRLAAEETKKDGSKRQTFDAHPPLKAIQTLIKDRFLARVEYPNYLNGSLRGRSTRKNATSHVAAKIAIGEDIANFFPSISSSMVHDIWRGLFSFSSEVAALLTKLTTKDDGVPQGAVTSSYLANLVFWAHEPNLVREFMRKGYEYTRFVDDITVSAKRRLSTSEQTQIVSAVYGMLLKRGLKPKRTKHEVNCAHRRMTTTKLVNNTRVSLPSERRHGVRAAVYQLETRVAFGEHDADLQKELARVSCRVGLLGSLHPEEAAPLKARVKAMRKRVTATSQRQPEQVSERIQHGSQAPSSDIPPWV